MKIYVVMNDVAGGWRPDDVMLGGSEECARNFTTVLAKIGHDVTLYASVPPLDHNGVKYVPRGAYDPSSMPDVLITWKDNRPWILGAKAKFKNIHWSSDIESRWPVPKWLDHYIFLSNYHLLRQEKETPEMIKCKKHVFPHGVASSWLSSEGKGKLEPWEERDEIAVYCSSPDRGLSTILEEWPVILRSWPDAKLQVFYGWRHFGAATKGSPQARDFEQHIARYIRQEGIEYYGEVNEQVLMDALSKARWWVHPLNRPESELYCLSAVKAQLSGAMPVILHADSCGMEDTVGSYIRYQDWVRGSELAIDRKLNPHSNLSWGAVISQFWNPILKEA